MVSWQSFWPDPACLPLPVCCLEHGGFISASPHTQTLTVHEVQEDGNHPLPTPKAHGFPVIRALLHPIRYMTRNNIPRAESETPHNRVSRRLPSSPPTDAPCNAGDH